MAKDKKKKKKEQTVDIDALYQEYTEGLEMIKAKNKQLDGMIQEVRLYLNEMKEMRDKMANIYKPLDDE